MQQCYFCYVLDQKGHVNARVTLEASHDNEAFGRAQCYLARNPSIPAIEIWLESRYMGKVHQQPLAATPRVANA